MYLPALRTVLTYCACAWFLDGIVRPEMAGRYARGQADAMGKPLLNMGAGTPGSSIRTAVLGPTMWGDVNLDYAAPPEMPHGPRNVSFGDAHDIPFPDNYFGAAVSTHLLEHVEDPHRALDELHRVTEGPVVIVTPKWWAPHTWLHQGHRWWVDRNGNFHPLWGGDPGMLR